MNLPTGNVCGDENSATSAFEFTERTEAGTLAELSVQRYGREAKCSHYNSKPATVY